MITVSIVQRKGGVGKTTIATHLAAGWALQGLRVCLIDTDSQGDAARALGMSPDDSLYRWVIENAPLIDTSPTIDDEGNEVRRDVIHQVPLSAYSTPDQPPTGALFIIPSSSRTSAIAALTDDPFILTDRIKQLEDLFDVVLIDTAPTISAFDAYMYLASDYFIYVTLLEELSLKGLEEGLAQVNRFAERRHQIGIGMPSRVLGVIPNMMAANTALHKMNLETIIEEHGAYKPNEGLYGLIWSPVYRRVKWAEANTFGQMVYAYAPSSFEARQATEMTDIATEVVKRVIAQG